MYGTYCRLNVHVYASALDVIRAFRTKLTAEFRADSSPEARARRKVYYRELLEIHANQRQLVQRFRL